MTTQQQVYEEYLKLPDNKLKLIIEYYYEQVDIVRGDEKKIKELKSKPQSKKTAKELIALMKQYEVDKGDLIQLDSDARIAETILAERQGDAPIQYQKVARSPNATQLEAPIYDAPVHRQKVTKSTPVTTHTAQLEENKKYKVRDIDRYKHVRTGYKIQLLKFESKLDRNVLQTAMDSIQYANNKNEMKDIFNYYKAVANGEQVPERLIPPQSSSAETHPPQSSSAETQPKPPKYVSQGIATQTAHTQTLVPLNAFKFIEKGENRFLEPMTPEKAEELAMKKKSIKSVTILNGNRFKRKPYIIYSRAH